jgi:hypothetical protein
MGILFGAMGTPRRLINMGLRHMSTEQGYGNLTEA